MVEVMSNTPEEEQDDDDEDEDDEETGNDTATESGYASTSNAGATARWDIDDDRLHLDAARIYEHTIVQLNERLGDPLEIRNMSAD
jgi:hypothetical protein